jgi:dihydropteroate synthase
MAASPPELARLQTALDAALADSMASFLEGAPTVLATRRRVLRFGPTPLLMGVLNVTPDSFSDGGAHADPERAISRAWEMAEQGADLIDVGGESTRPGAHPVSERDELNRVLPVLEGLAGRFPIPVSIDTYKSGVARQALEAGADIVNDITGLGADPRIARVAAEHGAPLVLSHIRGTPTTMQSSPEYSDVMAEVASDLLASTRLAAREGAPRRTLLVDPGIGFGKSLDHNLELIRRLPEIAGLGFPLLIGVSRKSFIGRILDRPPDARLEGSLAAAEAARLGGATIVRVHDVAESARFFATLAAIGESTESGKRPS